MSKERELMDAMRSVQAELTTWRGSDRGRKRIPAAIWEQATELARKYSVHAVSKTLGLSYGDLKRRVSGMGGHQAARAGRVPGFIEVRSVPEPVDSDCVIELAKGNGARMRICVKSVASVDWIRIKEAFLGA